MFLLFTFACSSLEPETRTIVSQIIKPLGADRDNTRVYEVGPVDGDSIVLPFGPDAFGEEEAEPEPVASPIDTEATLYLVDWLPSATWAHPATWVWLDDQGDILGEEVHEWFPVVDDEVFEPDDHEPIWGVPADPIGDVGPIEIVPELPRGIPADSITCPEEPEDVALSFTTWSNTGSMRDVVRFNGYIADVAQYKLYTTTPIVGTGQQRENAVGAWLDGVAAQEKNVGELVIFYSGHGSSSGTLIMGNRATGLSGMTAAELASKVQALDPESVTLVLDSCYSGLFARLFINTMARSEEGRRPDVRVLASSEFDEVSGGGSTGGLYTTALNDEFMASWDQPEWETVTLAPIPWLRTLRVGTLLENGRRVVRTTRVAVSQAANQHFRPFAVPRITISEGATVAQVCTAADLESQDYSRQLRLDGERFGEEVGQVEAESISGQWVPLEPVFWADGNVVFRMPMRAEGFPSDGSSASVNPGVEGVYLVRVVTEAGCSDPQPLYIRTQEYTQTYQPTTTTAWAELWHPVTPEATWTAGGTIHQSWVGLGTDLEPQVEYMDSQALHETSQGLQALPGWGYDLIAGDRNLATANDQSFPDFRYYGFRVVFGQDFPGSAGWEYTVVYD